MPPSERRSDVTKAAILRAARERFAQVGYQRATVRAIAAKAGIDPSMVIRYFGSKERLFAAAVEPEVGFPELGDVPADQVGETLVRHFVNRWERSDDDTLIVLLRSAVTDEAAAERLAEVFRHQVLPTVASVVGQGRAPRQAGLIASQILGMALCRYLLRLPPVVDLSQDEVVAALAPTVQRHLTVCEA